MIESSYYGVVTMTSLQNVRPSNYEPTKKTESDGLMDETRIKLVYYPDCQQLIIWLPADGSLYNTISLKNLDHNIFVWVKNIADIINGSIQIILDTLPISVGNFEITIAKSDGLIHCIHIRKYPEGQLPPEPVKGPEIPPDLDSEPIVYRDGFGKIIPDEDLIMRNQVIEKTINKVFRKVEYISQGRCGEVIYIEGQKSIKFYMEMGGGNCVFYLDIPSEATWEKRTNFSLEEREDIISFVAEQTQRDQASSCTYKISDTEITYFRR